jgi:hypothetical protein
MFHTLCAGALANGARNYRPPGTLAANAAALTRRPNYSEMTSFYWMGFPNPSNSQSKIRTGHLSP